MNIKSITLCPNVTFDFFHVQKAANSNADIFVNNYKPQISANSVALICFDDTVLHPYSAYGMTNVAEGYSFSVYRTTDSRPELEYITTLSDGALSMVDHNVENFKTYQYYIYKEDNNYSSVANITNPVYTNWQTWSITEFLKKDEQDISNQYQVYANLYPQRCWILDMNVESGNINYIYNKTIYDSLSTFPKVSVGKNNYAKGSLTAILGYIDKGNYIEYANQLENWRGFCGNGRLKILKDRAGHSWIVAIEDMDVKIADESHEQYLTTTFNWTEVMSTKEISIVE